jgi:hypothetical protein
MSKIVIPVIIIALILLIRGISVSYNINRDIIPKIEKPPNFVSQTVDTVIVNYKYDSDSIVDVINKYRDYNKYKAIGVDKELSTYADKYNNIIYNEVINGNKRINTVIPEAYRISAFAVYEKDTPNNYIGELWVNNKKENKRIMYPFLSNVGISCIRHNELNLCLMLVDKNDITNTDMRYWELLVCWYENYETVK